LIFKLITGERSKDSTGPVVVFTITGKSAICNGQGQTMILGKVIGRVVSTKKSDGIRGTRYLLINICDRKGIPKNEHLVALDLVSAGEGEMVLIAQGSSSRQTEMTKNKPIDAVIVGIVDLVEEEGSIVYRK